MERATFYRIGTGLFIFLIFCGAVVLVVSSWGPKRIAVANTGRDVVEVTVEGQEGRLLLGPSGMGYFDADSQIRIGDAAINVGERVEVVNTGKDIIEITYPDAAGTDQNMLLSQGGAVSVSKSVPFSIGDKEICVSEVQ